MEETGQQAQQVSTQDGVQLSESLLRKNPATSGTDSGFITDGRTSGESQREPSPSIGSHIPSQIGLASQVGSQIKAQNEASDSLREVIIDFTDANPLGLSEGAEELKSLEKDASVAEYLSPTLESTENFLDEKTPESSRQVTLTLTTAFAILKPPNKEEQANVSEKRESKGKPPKKVASSTKGQGYFHLEYLLFPDGAGLIKTDVVLFGAVAKLYMENESKVIKPWYEDDKIWLAWSQNVNLNVTNDFLRKISSHKVMFTMWNAKEKVSAKAKFDRPKGFRLTSPDDDTETATNNLVLKQRKLYEESKPQPAFISTKGVNTAFSAKRQSNKVTGIKPISAGADILEKLPSIPASPAVSAVHSKGGDTASSRSPSRIGNLPSLQQVFEEGTDKRKSPRQKSGDRKASTLTSGGNEIIPSVKGSKTDKKLKAKQQVPSFTMQLNFIPLLAGDETVTTGLKEPFPHVSGGYVTLAVDAPLVSQEQKRELNPLIITINSATSLPNTPVPIQTLKEKCVPVYCRYRFFDQPMHQTQDQEHGTHIYFKDMNVILTGAMSPGKLREYLRGPPMEIEVHDRDRKIEDFVKKPALFGTEPEDEKLSNVGLVASKRTVYNPFTEKDQMWNPYGVAKVNLSNLLLGEKCLNMVVPIHSSVPPDPIGYEQDNKSGKIMGIPGSVDGPQGSAFPTGHYLESNSALKIRVEIAMPLSPSWNDDDCPYGRIIYIFDDNHTTFLHELMSKIIEINAKALNLDEYPLYLIQECLPKMKLKAEDKGNPELDVITGFHILDGTIHIFVLEGLKDKAIKQLWDQLPARCFQNKDGKLEILYNSEMTFHQRLYEDLDAMVYHIRLHENISSIVKHPLLYVRHMVPPACFQALSRLDYLCHATKLREVIQGDLLPSVEMVNIMSREFGIPLSKEALLSQIVTSLPTDYLTSPDRDQGTHHIHSVFRVPLDSYNPKYMQLKREKGNLQQDSKDHIKLNIDAVYRMQRKCAKSAEKSISYLSPNDQPVYNYSSQTLNSAELAKKMLRQELATEPKQIFSYCDDYASATFLPVNVEEDLKSSIAKSKEDWLTPDGFVFTGFRSSIESNRPSTGPDEARVEELRMKWRENILHANILKPTLNRDRWNWEYRQFDFDLYKKPSSILDLSNSLTTQQSENTWKEWQEQAGQTGSAQRSTNSIVEDDKMKIHRCAAETELATQGLKASDQLSRLVGLLKGKPEKLSLRLPGMILKPLPALAILKNTDESTKRGFVPGLLPQHSLKWKSNMIPRHDMEHATYKELKGKDFNPYCSDHCFRYKREISALSEEEKESLLLQQQIRQEQPITPGNAKIKKSGSMVETQTINSLILHIE